MKSAVHAALGDEQDASAQGKDSTSDVEDGGADAAGGGKNGTLVILDICIKFASSSNHNVLCSNSGKCSSTE